MQGKIIIARNHLFFQRVKQYGQFMRPKQIIAEIEKDAGGVIEALSPCDIPRNRLQVCNKLRQVQNRPKARNTGRNRTPDYGKLVSLAQAGDFVRDFSIHRNQKKDATVPRVFAATECNIGWIKNSVILCQKQEFLLELS